jgi:hypothetical protein
MIEVILVRNTTYHHIALSSQSHGTVMLLSLLLINLRRMSYVYHIIGKGRARIKVRRVRCPDVVSIAESMEGKVQCAYPVWKYLPFVCNIIQYFPAFMYVYQPSCYQSVPGT